MIETINASRNSKKALNVGKEITSVLLTFQNVTNP